jgi:ATP-binding cassette subfamily F protein uup
LSYKDQRDLDRLPGELERLQTEIVATEDMLHDPALYTREPKRFAELTDRLLTLRAEKDSAEERWLEVAAMAEALQQQAS